MELRVVARRWDGTVHDVVDRLGAWLGWPRALIVGDWLLRPLVTVGPHVSLRAARRLAAERGVHHLVVASPAGMPMGMLCVCDLWGGSPDLKVWTRMSAPVDAVDRSAPEAAVASIIRGKHRGCVAVLGRGHVVGVLTRGDLLRAGLLQEQELPHCAACGTRHHVRQDPGSGVFKCLRCRAVRGEQGLRPLIAYSASM